MKKLKLIFLAALSMELTTGIENQKIILFEIKGDPMLPYADYLT